MQLANVIINTPKDDPSKFDPEWRHKVAMAWSTTPGAQWSSEYSDYKKDEWIVNQKRYLDLVAKAQREKRDPVLPRDLLYHRWALKWYRGKEPSEPKFVIEPLLLTAVSFDTIALDIAGGDVDPLAYKLYERLYFNIRRDDGMLHKACHLRTYFAMPDGALPNSTTSVERTAKVVGAQLGYGGLVTWLRWISPHGIDEELNIDYMSSEAWRCSQALLIDRCIRGKISDYDLAQYMGKFIEHSRLKKETGGAAGGTQAEMIEVVQSFLKQTAPRMAEITRSVDEDNARTEEIQARIISQQVSMGITRDGTSDGATKEKLERIIETKVKGKRQ